MAAHLTALVEQLVSVSLIITLGYQRQKSLHEAVTAKEKELDEATCDADKNAAEAALHKAKEVRFLWGGIGQFIGTIALPAMFFRAVATTNFLTMDLSVLLAVFTGKSMMVVLGLALGRVVAPQLYSQEELLVLEAEEEEEEEGPIPIFMVHYQTSEYTRPDGTRAPKEATVRAAATTMGGVLALLITNGDELGLGLPAMAALFPPDVVLMMFALASIQKCVISTFGFIALDMGLLQKEGRATSAAVLTRNILLEELSNPMIQGMLAGLALNLCVGMRGAVLPFYLDQPTSVLEHAFTPLVMFKAGMDTYGKLSNLTLLESAWLPFLAVLAKSLLLPLLLRALTSLFGGSDAAMNFAFMVGVLPMAGSSKAFVSKHASAKQLVFVDTALALSKLLAFPLLVAATGLLFVEDVGELANLELSVRYGGELLAGVASLWMLLSSSWDDQWNRPRVPDHLIKRAAALELAVAASRIVIYGDPRVEGESVDETQRTMLESVSSVLRWSRDVFLVLAVLDEVVRLRFLGSEYEKTLCASAAASEREASFNSSKSRDALEQRPPSVARQPSGASVLSANSHVAFAFEEDRGAGCASAAASEREASFSSSKSRDSLMCGRRVNWEAAPPILAFLKWGALPVAVCVGLSLTLPWALLADSGVERWAPTGASPWWIFDHHSGQLYVYTAVYVLALGINGCLAVLLIKRALALPHVVTTDGSTVFPDFCFHTYSLKIELLLFLVLTRHALCLSLSVASLRDAQQTGAVGIITVLIAVHDCALGPWFLLFVPNWLPPLVANFLGARLLNLAESLQTRRPRDGFSSAANGTGHEPLRHELGRAVDPSCARERREEVLTMWRRASAAASVSGLREPLLKDPHRVLD